MLGYYDYGVMGFYLLFMLAIGVVFRKFSKDSSDFFRGGGSMLWWMTGGSAFMMAFSAWTFTGAAGKAYEDGTLILIVYCANAVGFFISYLWSSHRFRQMRVVTPMEAVRDRFGPANEAIFTWLQIPMSILVAGIWLNGLAVFLTAVFGFKLELTIIAVGFVVVFLSSAGGAWAVVAGDFMQLLILMPVTFITALLALYHPDIGGPAQFLEKLPREHFQWDINARVEIVIFWVVAVIAHKIFSINNVLESSRFLCAKDSRHARKAALFASILFLIGPIIWFIPPMAAAIIHPDLSAVFPELGSKANEGAYVALCLNSMPTGLMGLLISGIFAATVSSMDSGLNRNVGIFVKNFYKPVFRKQASERELVLAGKLVTIVFGILIILTALNFSRMKDLGLFDLMLQFGSLIALPYSIPLVLGMLVKGTPPWAGWTTILVGFMTSTGIKYGLDAEFFRQLLGFSDPLNTREINDYIYFASILVNIVVCSAWFIGSKFLRSPSRTGYDLAVDNFIERMNTPISESETRASDDRIQQKTLGRLCLTYGGFILLLILIPNQPAGRLCFLFCGGTIFLIGYLLNRQSNQTPISKSP